MTEQKIGVLLVEDSPVIQLLLVYLINSDPRLEVVGTAKSGEEALELLARKKPHIILMDVHLPKMNGLEATRRIMETQPLPIVVTSATLKSDEIAMSFQAIEAGALAFVEKPVGPGNPRFDEMAGQLLETVRLMSEIKVVKRHARLRRPATPSTMLAVSRQQIEIVAIGASTGGPPALRAILSGLPKDFVAPVLIVQHIAAGFLHGLADWLHNVSGLPVHVAANGQSLQPGHVYVAPENAHMGVNRGGIVLSSEPSDNNLRPSVAHLFRSVAGVYRANAAGVLLTGMGRDGADELKLLRNAGAVTFAQDAESSIVHGMPGEAIKLGAALYILPPDRIAATLAGLSVLQRRKT